VAAKGVTDASENAESLKHVERSKVEQGRFVVLVDEDAPKASC
jgi:hypothetical protein